MKLSFVLDKIPSYAISYKNGRKTFEVQAFDGQINVDVVYDYNRRPLGLVSQVALGDKIEVVILPHRIELYVNGILEDEEWPIGVRFFENGDEIKNPQEAQRLIDSLFACANAEYTNSGRRIISILPIEELDKRF